MFNLPEPFIVNDKIPGITGILNDNNDNLYLSFLYEKIGLYSDRGDINNNIMIIDGVEYTTLSEANDEGVSWKDIADYIENNPENIFTKSI